MADNDKKNQGADKPAGAAPRFDPKPVQVGGESILDRVLPHMRKIVWVVVVTAGILGIFFTIVWWRDRGYSKETERVSAVLDVASKQVRPPSMGSNDPAAKETFATDKDRALAVLDAIAKQGTDVSPAFRASLLVQAGKLDEAIASYKQATTAAGIDGVLAREGLGLAQEMKASQDKDPAAQQKGLEEALATFQAMQPDDKGPRRAYALYHQGRILGMLNKRADAKAALEKAKALGKDSELSELVDQRLASLGAS